MRTLGRVLLGMGVSTLLASTAAAQTGPLPSQPVPVQPMYQQAIPPVGLGPPQVPPVGLGTPGVPPPPLPYDGRTTQSLQVPVPGGPPAVYVQGGPQLGAPIPGQPLPPLPPPPPGPILVPPPPPGPAVNIWAGPAGWNQRPAQPPGWFFDVGFDIIEPEVRNHLNNTVTFPSGATATVALPGHRLDWTAEPEFGIGYCLGNGLGTFAVNYRFIATDGRDFQPGDDGSDELRSRLNVNIFDFDYITNTFEPLPRLEMQGRLGARLGLGYYDTQLTGVATDMRESTNYVGAGPHAALDLTRRIVLIPGLAVCGKIDGAILVGQDRQNFNATAFDVGGSDIQGFNTSRGTVTSEMLAVEVGMSYRVPDLEALRFSTGYRYEQWWDMGRSNGTGVDLTTNGFFFRVEYGF